MKAKAQVTGRVRKKREPRRAWGDRKRKRPIDEAHRLAYIRLVQARDRAAEEEEAKIKFDGGREGE